MKEKSTHDSRKFKAQSLKRHEVQSYSREPSLALYRMSYSYLVGCASSRELSRGGHTVLCHYPSITLLELVGAEEHFGMMSRTCLFSVLAPILSAGWQVAFTLFLRVRKTILSYDSETSPCHDDA
jgi:hypothetical protein